MKLVIGFLLGVSVATAIPLLAQESGFWRDDQGHMGTMYQWPYPGGPTTYQDLTTGERRSLYPMTPNLSGPKNPC